MKLYSVITTFFILFGSTSYANSTSAGSKHYVCEPMVRSKAQLNKPDSGAVVGAFHHIESEIESLLKSQVGIRQLGYPLIKASFTNSPSTKSNPFTPPDYGKIDRPESGIRPKFKVNKVSVTDLQATLFFDQNGFHDGPSILSKHDAVTSYNIYQGNMSVENSQLENIFFVKDEVAILLSMQQGNIFINDWRVGLLYMHLCISTEQDQTLDSFGNEFEALKNEALKHPLIPENFDFKTNVAELPSEIQKLKLHSPEVIAMTVLYLRSHLSKIDKVDSRFIDNLMESIENINTEKVAVAAGIAATTIAIARWVRFTPVVIGVASIFASSGSWAYTSTDILENPALLLDANLSKDELVSHLIESDGDLKELSERVIQLSTQEVCREHYVAELCSQ